MKAFKRAVLGACCAWCAVIVFLFAFRFAGFAFCFGESADQGLYRVVNAAPAEGPPKAGERYAIRWQWDELGAKRGLHHEGYDMLKEVAGVPGQCVWLKSDQVFIDYEPVKGCTILKADKAGNKLPIKRQYPYILEQGEYFLASHNPIGWDSRYFGPVPIEELTRRAYPVWIFKTVDELPEESGKG